MEKRDFKGMRSYQGEESKGLDLKYYILEKPINPNKSYYGIEIESSTEYNRLFLSESKEWVEALIDKFIGNGVTPSTMTYIIDDIMGIPC